MLTHIWTFTPADEQTDINRHTQTHKQKLIPLSADTVESLIEGLSEAERLEALIVVMVAEPLDAEYVENIVDAFKRNFGEHLDSGLLEIITPHPSFYPDFDKVMVRCEKCNF